MFLSVSLSCYIGTLISVLLTFCWPFSLIFGLLFIIYLLIVTCRFSPIDTNSVLREFEKCGVILKHILGPRDANWMHILYQVCHIPINMSSCSASVVHACIHTVLRAYLVFYCSRLCCRSTMISSVS